MSVSRTVQLGCVAGNFRERRSCPGPVYLAVVGTEHAIRYFVEAQERAQQLSEARFAALQAQVNPHFLFNTLNTVGVLVRDGERSAAARIVEQLSEVLRRTLTRHRTNEVRLEDELELVRQYLGIEQARFSDRLRPQFDVDDEWIGVASGTQAAPARQARK